MPTPPRRPTTAPLSPRGRPDAPRGAAPTAFRAFGHLFEPNRDGAPPFFTHLGDDPRYVRLHGSDPIWTLDFAVAAKGPADRRRSVTTPDGRTLDVVADDYWAFWGTGTLDGSGPHTLRHMYHDRRMLEIVFPYGSTLEVERRGGAVLHCVLKSAHLRVPADIGPVGHQ